MQVSSGGIVYVFSAWSDNDASTTKTVNLTANQSFTATYIVASHNLIITSTPSGVQFALDGTSMVTPATVKVMEGAHTLAFSQTIQSGGLSYTFQSWSDGVTTPSRTLNVTSDVSLSASYTPILHTLSIASNLSAVAFTFDGTNQATPFTASVPEGMHTIIMPTSITVSGQTYNFSAWSDGNTSSTRTLTLTADLTLQANYVLLAYPLTVQSSPVSGLGFTLDGIGFTTPVTITVTPGTHTLVVPSTVTAGGTTYTFQQWSDGTTNPTKTLNVAGSVNLTVVYLANHQLTISSNLTGIQVTVDSVVATTPATFTLPEGMHTVSVPTTLQAGNTLFAFTNWNDGITQAARTVNLTQDLALTANYQAQSGLVSFNPHIPYQPVLATLAQIFGTATATCTNTLCGVTGFPSAGATFDQGGAWAASIPCRRQIIPPAIVNNKAVFVEIDNLQPAGPLGSGNQVNSCTRYNGINFGGACDTGSGCTQTTGPNYPDANGDGLPDAFTDTVSNLTDTNSTFYNTNRNMARINWKINRDLKAWNVDPANPTRGDWLPADISLPTSSRVDVQGFLFWAPENACVTGHNCSGWELWMTGWRQRS